MTKPTPTPANPTPSIEKPPKADVQTLAYLLKEIENRIVEERKSRKQFALSMIVFGVLFLVGGFFAAANAEMQHQQKAGLAALRREPLPEQTSTSGLPFVVGFGMIAYGFSKQW